IYSTVIDKQESARIRVFQGENPDTRYNSMVGEFVIESLADVPSGNQIVVRLDLDLNGILKVTATERATGLAKHIVIDNAMERFRQSQRSDAIDRLETVMGTVEEGQPQPAAPTGPAGLEPGTGAMPSPAMPQEDISPPLRQAIESAEALIAKAE